VPAAERQPIRSLRFHGTGDLRLDLDPGPMPGRHDVIVAPLAVGVCGTDSHIVGGHFAAEPGVVLGHEICGTVVELGPEVDALAVGDLVTVEPHDYCTSCVYCRAGAEHLCEHKRGYGVRLDGGMTDRMKVPARIAYRLPPDTPPWIGALTEPVSCCIHGMDQLHPVSGTPLLLYGCGPAGAILIALARLQGLAPIVVMDPLPSRRELAIRMGADLALDPGSPGAAGDAFAVTGGHGFARVVDGVGSGRVLEEAVRMAARGARILVFGVARPEDVAPLRPYEIFQRELTIVGSVINPYTHQRAVALLPRLGLDRLRPAFFELADIEGALSAQAAGSVDKVFMAPAGEHAAGSPELERPTQRAAGSVRPRW
jgi:L-iditol 2-dehydrogenase